MKYLYLLINFLAVIFPVVFSFHPKIRFYQRWKGALVAILVSSIPFLIWDMVFTGNGIWGFNIRYLSGYYLFNIPVEEALFFFCIPYSCLFTYHCLNIFSKNWRLKINEHLVTASVIIFLSIASLVFLDRLYTIITFAALIFLLFFLKYFLKVHWLGRFYFAYFVLLIPFTIVNGILTGTGLSEPIVWYNNNENMGFRFLTIPIEDIFYGMLLILLNTTIFEYLEEKSLKEKTC